MDINHKGYVIGQAKNHHVYIFKDGRMVMHAQCNKFKSEEELKADVDRFIEMNKDALDELHRNPGNIRRIP